MNTLMVTVGGDEEIVGYDEAEFIIVFEMETGKVIKKFIPSQMRTLEEIMDMSDSCILVTSSLSEEKLLEIEDHGIKVIIVSRRGLQEFLNEIF